MSDFDTNVTICLEYLEKQTAQTWSRSSVPVCCKMFIENYAGYQTDAFLKLQREFDQRVEWWGEPVRMHEINGRNRTGNAVTSIAAH